MPKLSHIVESYLKNDQLFAGNSFELNLRTIHGNSKIMSLCLQYFSKQGLSIELIDIYFSDQ